MTRAALNLQPGHTQRFKGEVYVCVGGGGGVVGRLFLCLPVSPCVGVSGGWLLVSEGQQRTLPQELVLAD